MLRDVAGDRESAEDMARQAAGHGDTDALCLPGDVRALLKRLWPCGLDPDGTPTPPWQ
ncbi:hypothetical protein [Streptomyces sp. NPDC093094]|uniref:hypothetical protein n=1 Tax=Streptomyces sp. NPDC093094 TaxID=3366026 RepID=UPI00382968C1